MTNSIEKALQRKKELEKQLEAQNAANNAVDVYPIKEEVEESAPIVATEIEEGDNQNTTNALQIDLERLEARGSVSLTGIRKQINDEFREIKRKLIHTAFGPLSSTLNNSNIIMVTSSRPSEGKTFTAVNLALSIASEQDKTVLLVDSDVLKPNVLRTLGVDRKKGLMEYLRGEVNDISEVLYHTNVDKLKIIPAGRSHHLSTEYLASQKMKETIDEFSNRYSDRVVIIDSPPLIGITETAVLANFAGQAAVVVEEGKAKLSDIKTSVERLNPEMAIGFIINKSIYHDDSSGYYGYYYSEDSQGD